MVRQIVVQTDQMFEAEPRNGNRKQHWEQDTFIAGGFRVAKLLCWRKIKIENQVCWPFLL